MKIAFTCRIHCNCDIPKLKKFFEETDTLNIAAGKSGIAFSSVSPGEICYYLVMIHSSDIYQLSCRSEKEIWKYGGVVRTLPASSLLDFIRLKGNGDQFFQFDIDEDATTLRLSIVSGITEQKSIEIPLTVPILAYSFPPISYANVVIKVNDFKKLCSDIGRISPEINISYQDAGIRFFHEETSTYGHWDDNKPLVSCTVKTIAFNKVTKINIGNTKNSFAGIYMSKDDPLCIKIKLGIVDFRIYSILSLPK